MMKKLIFSFLGLLMAAGAMAQAPQLIPNDPEVRIGTTPSGIRYYLRHNGRDPQRANFHICYNVGAIQEQDNQNGLAHFLEHMAFNGSKNFPDNKLIDYLESIGVRFGENLNAETGQETTTYMVTNVPLVRETVIDSALLILHDWAGFISLNENDIDDERGVIREEWRQGNNAQRRTMESQFPVIFNNSIYAKRNVIGNEEVLRTFKYQELRDFYHKWYQPNMMAFVIVGDFDVDMMEKKLLATMSDIPVQTTLVEKDKVVIPNNETTTISILSDPEQTSTQVQLIFRHEPIPTEFKNTVDARFMETMGTLISDMFTLRALEISQKSDAPFLSGGGGYISLVQAIDAFYIGATARDGESLRALEAAYTELLRMQRGGFTQGELDRAKANMKQDIDSEWENRENRRNRELVNEYMANFTENKAFPTPDINKDLNYQLLDAITLDQINAVAASYVRDINNSILVVSPKKESITIPTEAQILEVIAKVKASDIKIYTENAITKPLISKKLKGSKVIKTEDGMYGSKLYTLKNGVKVVVKPTDYDGDKISMEAFQKGGTSQLSDVADLYSINLYGEFAGMAGIGDFSAMDIHKILAGNSASVSTRISDLSQGFNGSASLKDLETLMQLTYLRFTAPRFNPTDWDVFVSQYKDMIPNISKNPDYIYSDSMVNTIYSRNPRASIISAKTIDMVSVQRLEKAYRQLYSNAKDMTFVFIGKMDEAKMLPLFEKYLGSLPSSKATAEWGTNRTEIAKGVIENEFKLKIETPKVTATQVNSGTLDYTLENRLMAQAISYILDIRYIKSIREEKGGTYGVHVATSIEKFPTPRFALNISFQTDPSKIDELMPIIQKEIQDMMRDGVSEENLAKYKEFNLKKFAENQTNNKSWMHYLTSYYDQGDNFYDGYTERMNSITPERIRKMANDMFSQNNIIKVIMLPSEDK